MNIFILVGKKGWKSHFFFADKYIKIILKLVTNTTLRKKKTEVAIGKQFYKCIIDGVIKSMKYMKNCYYTNIFVLF